ncbi:MAG: hypothetical protein ACR2NB_07510 [Solirubrobacteraceae bacterium]
MADLSDEQLLYFPRSELGGYSREPRGLLREYGDVYRAQLRMARHLTTWAEHMKDHSAGLNPQYRDGYEEALLNLAAHLRQGDYLPGGQHYEEPG